jgi:RimJ/RimL family protein N-acetyltransferase
LRLITEDDVPLIEALRSNEQAASFNWFGFPKVGGLRHAVADGKTLGAHDGQLAVVRGDKLLGSVSWNPQSYGPHNPAFNMGIGLFPEARGKGYGTQAQRLLIEYLFATTTVNRIEAGTDVDNLAEQKSLTKAGFVREGVLRGAQFRNGKWRDLVSYSVIREDLTKS